MITPPFVKKFDFRGKYNRDIKNSDSYYLALAIYNIIKPKKMLIGWDTRTASKNLAFNFICALSKKNILIHYLDRCPIDFITASSYGIFFDLSIMFTGSHNPWDWSGLLIHTKNGDSVTGNLVKEIIKAYYKAKQQPYYYTRPDLAGYHNYYENISNIVIKKIKQLIPINEIKPLKVIVDIGDGSGSTSIELLEKILPQINFIKLNNRKIYDQNTPHPADPSITTNLKQLSNAVKKSNAIKKITVAAGFAFDSDADRILAVDENGNILNGTVIANCYLDILRNLKLNYKEIGYAVDCGLSIYNNVREINRLYNNNIKAYPVPVGRSIIRQLIRKTKLDFAAENVGHFYSRDFFMTDSGLFSIVIVLYWLSFNQRLSLLNLKYPNGFQNQYFTDKPLKIDFQKLNKSIKHDLLKKNNIDGIRYEFFQNDIMTAWYAVRKSGYENLTKYIYGAIKKSEFLTFNRIFRRTD